MIRSLLFIFLFSILHSTAQTVDTNAVNSRASFYHNRFHGQETSSGETYDKDDFTAAHRTLPFNTLLLVTNKKNNKSVIVRVNDRGPFKRSRVVDLSYAAAKKIGMVPFGVVPVKIEILRFLDKAPIDDSLLAAENTWDCFGNRQSLQKNTVYIWRTDNWKHAFYMASSLTLEFKLDMLVVKIKGQNGSRNYYLLATGIETKKKADELVTSFRRSGFLHSKIYEER